MRRLFTVLLAAVAVFALFATTVAAQPVTPIGTFLDDNGNVHEADIEAIADAGLTVGCNPPASDLYCPSDSVTRQQMASFIKRAISLAPSAVDAFTDDTGSIHENDINAIAAVGITFGCNPPANDRFCPTRPVTRAQMASFLVRGFGIAPSAVDAFTDDAGLVHEADINAIAAAGISFGCNPPANDQFCPTGLVTRAQMASFLTRAMDLTPLPPPSVSEANLTRVFFFLDQPTGGPFLATTARYGHDPVTPEVAVDYLLSGPTAPEKAQTPSFSSTIPTGVVRNGPITVAAGTATVDLSENFDDGGGTASMTGRLAELTFTLTAFDTIDKVKLKLDGVPVTVFSSEGLVLPADGLDRAYFLPTMSDPLGAGIVAEVSPESPAWFEFVENPIEVRGLSRTFEATVSWALYDNDGLELASGFATTGGSGPEFGVMSFDVSYTVPAPELGTLQVWWDSPKDGAVTDLREVAVWLMP
ncbi:MAG: GerMN domain-containing protein [Acidimicrobiia bacterium]|nr:GerMN domain-containing protein [Acidimicrobiia bacterium]MDH5503968.1 GerMN domain-containing protein [Acidimicrobiia bacterium]